jgi:hypothetical protein
MTTAVTEKRVFSHQPHFSPEEFALEPHRPDEQRYIPNAFTPKNGVVEITKQTARFTFEYTVTEDPMRNAVELRPSTQAILGKYTKKVLEIVIEYGSLDTLYEQIGLTAKAVKSSKAKIPQDSIRRNYDMIIAVLMELRVIILKDMDAIRESVAKETIATE